MKCVSFIYEEVRKNGEIKKVKKPCNGTVSKKEIDGELFYSCSTCGYLRKANR